MDLTKPNNHWLYNKIYKNRSKLYTLTRRDGTPYIYYVAEYSVITEGLNSSVDYQHMWSIFTMYWPQIFAAVLHGRE